MPRGGMIYISRGPPEISYEKQVLGLDRACSEFGLSADEVQAMPPCRYNSYYGNSVPVWNKQQLSDARAQKQAAAERALEQKHGGKDGLAAHRASVAAAANKKRAGERAEALRSTIAGLMPGRNPPRGLPDFVSTKKDAKALFFLTDADLKKLADAHSGAALAAMMR